MTRILLMTRIHSVEMQFLTAPFARRISGVNNPIPSMTCPVRSIHIVNRLEPLSGLPGMFKNCRFPILQRLELSGFINTFPPCLLGPTLVHSTLSTSLAQYVNPKIFFQHLSQMSQLEWLHLEGITFRDNAGTHIPRVLTRRLSLPNLRRLNIAPPFDGEQDNALLLEHLELPADARSTVGRVVVVSWRKAVRSK